MSRLLDNDFVWVRPESTDVTETWRKHGWKPVTDAERRARQQKRYAGEPTEQTAGVRVLKRAK
jgi:hypothetical protein